LDQVRNRLYTRLGYAFSEPALLDAALTHRSAGGINNERLEFLGDAILGFVIADILYDRFPNAQEGELSRLRANLVKGETLAEIARRLQLGDELVLGPGELKSGGFRRDSILAGALEALIGAVFLDGGLEDSRRMVKSIFGDLLATSATGLQQKDPKTRLQEHLQAHRIALPAYDVHAVEGLDHDQTFHVTCVIEGVAQSFRGTGTSRRKAEQDAAEKALRFLGGD